MAAGSQACGCRLARLWLQAYRHMVAGSHACGCRLACMWLQAAARACSKLGGTRCLSQGSLEIQSNTVVSHTWLGLGLGLGLGLDSGLPHLHVGRRGGSSPGTR